MLASNPPPGAYRKMSVSKVPLSRTAATTMRSPAEPSTVQASKPPGATIDPVFVSPDRIGWLARPQDTRIGKNKNASITIALAAETDCDFMMHPLRLSLPAFQAARGA